MSHIAIIVDVAFAIYLMNFVGSFMNAITRRRGDRARLWADIALGVFLLAAVIFFSLR